MGGPVGRARPEPLDAALIFAPPARRPARPARVRARGVVVCAGIHMSDIPSFPYEALWEERVLRSVANLTRADAREFLALAPEIPIRTTVTEFAWTRRRRRDAAAGGRDRGQRRDHGRVSCPAYGPRPVRLAAPARAAKASAAGVS